ncbi:hypothetical protein [Denitromonas sp.]|uniref:hypothetical protein n=1 Tax=Denitromonas sp. TaxID=2734609 RepID=UPI002AFE6A49|nr:hypothetical protein [Denitromonas sp.]
MFLPAITDVDNKGQHRASPVLARVSVVRHEKRWFFVLRLEDDRYRRTPMFSTGDRRWLNRLSTARRKAPANADVSTGERRCSEPANADAVYRRSQMPAGRKPTQGAGFRKLNTRARFNGSLLTL